MGHSLCESRRTLRSRAHVRSLYTWRQTGRRVAGESTGSHDWSASYACERQEEEGTSRIFLLLTCSVRFGLCSNLLFHLLQQQVNPASHQLTCSASATLAKCGFLCTVLAENPEYHNLAFRVGLFGLEMARPPASTKPLEVNIIS